MRHDSSEMKVKESEKKDCAWEESGSEKSADRMYLLLVLLCNLGLCEPR